MSQHHVDLSDHLKQFIGEQVAAGRYNTASDVIAAGLYLLEQQEQSEVEKLNELRRLAKEGFDAIDRGECFVLNSREEIEAKIMDIARSAALGVK